MAFANVFLLLLIVVVVCLIIFLLFKGRKRTTSFVIAIVLLISVILGFYFYFTNTVFKREVNVRFHSTARYIDLDNQATLPLPDHTALDYRYGEHSYVFYTTHSPNEVYSFYKNTRGMSVQDASTNNPAPNSFHVSFQGHTFSIILNPVSTPEGCMIMITS